MNNYLGFWKGQACSFVWDRRFDPVCERTASGSRRWFPGGRLNYSFNVLDRKVREGLGAREILTVYPAAGAVRRYTYSSLLESVQKLSFFLRAKGIGKNSKVLLLLPNDDKESAILLALALQRVGALFGFVYAGLPRRLIRSYLQRTGADTLIYTDQLRREPAPRGVRPVTAACLMRGMRDAPASGSGVSVDPSRAGFWVFTSGTTAAPKIVETGHLGYFLSLIVFQKDLLGLTAGSSLLMGLHYAFGPSIGLMYAALFLGIRLVQCEIPGYLETGTLARIITTEDVDALTLAPAFLSRMKHSVKRPLAIGFTGDKISARQWVSCCRLFPEAKVVNAYGLTETMACLCSAPVPARPERFGRINALEAFPGIRYCIRGKDNGGRGRLWIRTPFPSLCRGYRGNRRDFIRRFNRDFSCFDTQDMAGEKAGCVEILGRSDNLVKVNCRYLEPGLIEREAGGVRGVRAAKVICRGGRIYLFVAGPRRAQKTLAARIRARIGSYAVPERVFFLSALPVGETGKISEKELCGYLGGM